MALPAGSSVTAAPKNVQSTYILNAGDYIQWQESGEMSGTVIQSTKPVSFFGGQGYDCYDSATSAGGGCDSAHQQVPQVSAFGSEYAVAPYTTRRSDLNEESIRYRFVGAATGTQLTYSPPVAGAPTTLGLAQVVDFQAVGPFVVKAQDNNHPFFVAQIMSGCDVTSGSRAPGGCLGDEEYVNILAPAQFLTKYVFFSDPTYPTTNLVLTRVKTGGTFKDVKLDCGGTLSGWKPLGGTGQYEYTNFDLIRGGAKSGSCDNGPHVRQQRCALRHHGVGPRRVLVVRLSRRRERRADQHGRGTADTELTVSLQPSSVWLAFALAACTPSPVPETASASPTVASAATAPPADAFEECPHSPPRNGTPCNTAPGAVCTYTDDGGTEACTCHPDRRWSCSALPH